MTTIRFLFHPVPEAMKSVHLTKILPKVLKFALRSLAFSCLRQLSLVMDDLKTFPLKVLTFALRSLVFSCLHQVKPLLDDLAKLPPKVLTSALMSLVFSRLRQLRLVMDDLTKLQSTAWGQVLRCLAESSPPVLHRLGSRMQKSSMYCIVNCMKKRH